MTPLTLLLSLTLSITGQVRDSVSHAPLAGVTVVNVATHDSARTDAAGRFDLPGSAPARLRFTIASHTTREIDVPAGGPDLVVELAPRARALEGVTVTAIRGADAAPVSRHTVTREDIERRYSGEEVPLVLAQAPSMTAYAETGTYWGYSYMRLRGIDQSRINLSLDGIPLNDPEDQVLYFADFPDLANSVQSAEIQRGVGTTGTGTAAYAGSINFETIPLGTSRPDLEAQLTSGSFGARRLSVEGQTGILPSRFAVYGRVSALQETGYRRHSGVEGRSAFLSAGWFGDRDIVKLTATAGLLRDTMAYLAAAESDIAADRRVNYLRPDETDQFGEQLVALNYTHLMSERSSWSTTAYRISASGNYDVFIDPDLWNFHLDFAWYGATTAWRWTAPGLEVSAGANVNTYARDHYLYIRPDLQTRVYTNTGHKRDASTFVKASYDVGSLTWFGDVQARWAEFLYTPDANAGIPEAKVSWSFLNPKAGVTWHMQPSLAAYVSYGINQREPARSDMFAGFDNLDTSNVAFVGSLDRVSPERVNDLEVGITRAGRTLALAANVYAMRFRNEILPIGQLSYIGTPLRKNVPASARSGVEVDATWRATPRFTLGGNAGVSHSRIREYTDDASGNTYHDVEPLLTPRLTLNHRADLRLTPRIRLGVDGRYVGSSHLQNTGDGRFMLPEAYTLDATLAWQFGPHELMVQGNNLANSTKYASGYADGTTSYYYVLPPRNFLVTARLHF